MTIEINLKLIHQFDELTSYLVLNKILHPLEFKDSFLLKNHEGKIDLLVNCCTHGNEIIGLSIINKILLFLKNKSISTNLNIAFTLANREAVYLNSRIAKKDLNRSFLTSARVEAEDLRARELETIATNCVAVFDIHQTSTESVRPFFVMRHIEYNYAFIHEINIPEWPIILYKEGKFSKDGDAYSSFCLKYKIPFLTLELSQVGLHPLLEERILNTLLKIFEKHNLQTWSNLFSIPNFLPLKNEIFQEELVVLKKTNDDYLVDGLKNLSLISKNSPICTVDGILKNAEKDYFALFPKYGIYKINSSELVRLLVKK